MISTPIKIVIGVIIVALLVYFLFFYNKKNDNKMTDNGGCPSSFTINPFGNLIENAVAKEYSTDGTKYFVKNRAGYLGYGIELAPKEISKEAFMAACKTYQSQSTNQ